MREEENCYQSRQLSSCHRRSPEGERQVNATIRLLCHDKRWGGRPPSGRRNHEVGEVKKVAVRVSTDLEQVVGRSMTWDEERTAHKDVGGTHGLRLIQVAPNLGGSQRQTHPQA